TGHEMLYVHTLMTSFPFLTGSTLIGLWYLMCSLFPYTTLFRSRQLVRARMHRHHGGVRARRPRRRRWVWVVCAVHRGLPDGRDRSEEHTPELQSREKLVCRLLLEKEN